MAAMTAISFEAGTIADVINRAGRIAPKRGEAFDKAAGIVFDVDPNSATPCIVRTTDLEVYFIETIDVIKAEGAAVRWRLPSAVLMGVIGTLPSTAGTTVTFVQDDKKPAQVTISCNRLRSTLNLFGNLYYPEWDTAGDIELTLAPNLGELITRVEWAASKAGPPPLDGVHFTGEHLIATDRYKIARVPCEIDLPNGPVTIPARSIGSVIKPAGDVYIGMEDNLFVVSIDDYTQIKTITYGAEFLPVGPIVDREYPQRIEFRKADLVGRIQRAQAFAGAERHPVITIFLGKSELAVMMQNDEVGLLGDVIELPGQATHKRIIIRCSPSMILDGLNNATSDTVSLLYNPTATNKPFRIEDASGYMAWIAPRGEKAPTP